MHTGIPTAESSNKQIRSPETDNITYILQEVVLNQISLTKKLLTVISSQIFVKGYISCRHNVWKRHALVMVFHFKSFPILK